MSSRDTLNSTVSTAGKTQAAAVLSAVQVAQTTIDAANSVVGYNNVNGSYGNLAAAVKTANLAKANAIFAAEQAKQASIAVARDTLRSAGGDAAAF
jgi:hypothetical protein